MPCYRWLHRRSKGRLPTGRDFRGLPALWKSISRSSANDLDPMARARLDDARASLNWMDAHTDKTKHPTIISGFSTYDRANTIPREGTTF